MSLFPFLMQNNMPFNVVLSFCILLVKCARIAHGWMVLQHSFPHCKWSREKCFKILLFASCILFLNFIQLQISLFNEIPFSRCNFTLWYTNQTVLPFCSRSFSKTIPIEVEQVRITLKSSIFLPEVNMFSIPSREYLYKHWLLA